MSTPDVRVRLSPEGIKEVIFALRQIEAESKKSRQAAGSGLSTIKAAVQDLKALLPTLGLAATVGGFLAMSKAALNTADATGKIQQAVGGTVEEISGLTLAFRTNDGSQESLRSALLKTTQVLGQVRAGSTQAGDALRAIGVDAQQIVNLSTPRAFEEIARKLRAIPDPAQRAAAAQAIFGKNAGALTAALNAVGRDGIDPFIEKARELGVLIDDDLAQAAARANDALGIVKLQAEGLATQFAAGLAPAVADAMETFNEAITGEGINGMRTFGEVVGFIIRTVTAFFVGFGKTIGAEIAKVGVFVSSVIDAGKALARGDLDGALTALQEGAAQRARIQAELQADLAQLGRDLVAGPNRNQRPREPGAGGGVDVDFLLDQQRKAAAATREARKQAIADELKLQQEKIKSEEAALQRSYDQQLISLQQFYDRRRELIERNNAIELTALRAQRQALVQQLNEGGQGGETQTEADRIKLRQQIASIDAQIQQRQVVGARELAALEGDRIAAQRELQNELTAANTKLLELEGRRHEAFRANLDAEIRQLRELGARAGQTADEIDANVRRLVSARTAAFDFEEVQRRGEAALAAFDRDAQQIRRDQEAGIITQLEGEQRLIELERERLGVLQQLAQQLLIAAEATGSEEQIERARQFAASVDQIAASYQQATDIGLQFRSGAVEAFQSGIESLLANASKIESVGDAFRQLGLTVVQTLNRIAAEILAKQAILALLRAFGGGGAAAGSAAAGAAGAFRGGYIRGYAGGGDVRGSKLPIAGPDKIPILAQEGEFMLRKARVQEPGALSFLRAWNSGRISLAQALRVPRFASGGEIGAPAAAAAGAPGGSGQQARTDQLRIVNILDPELVNEALASASGERTMLNVIQKNSTSIRRMLGG